MDETIRELDAAIKVLTDTRARLAATLRGEQQRKIEAVLADHSAIRAMIDDEYFKQRAMEAQHSERGLCGTLMGGQDQLSAPGQYYNAGTQQQFTLCAGCYPAGTCAMAGRCFKLDGSVQ